MSDIPSDVVIKKIKSGEYKCQKNEIGKSSVWKHFEEIYESETKSKIDYVQCTYCKCILKYKSSSGSSRLSRHANSCSSSRSSKCLESFFHPKEKQVPAASKKAVLESCIKLCSEDLRPFDIIEGSGFLHFAQNLISLGASLGNVKAEDVLPHRTTISKHVRQTAENCRKDMLPRINKILGDVGGALTTDMWTEPFRQVSYLSITCHYVDENFNLKSHVLSTCSFPNVPKTGINIKDELLHTLEKIGFDISLLTKCTFVTDEGSNIVSALKCYNRISCVCHLLNTVLKHSYKETVEDFPNLKSSVEKCKLLVTYLKKSGAVNELKKTVHQEVDCRWNTLCSMVRSVISQFTDIKDLILRKNEGHRLKEINLEILEFLVDFLKIFEDASTQLEGDSYPTLHRVLLWYEYLKKYSAPKVTDSEMAKCIKKNTETWLIKKIKINDLHKIATFLHPKYKSLKMLDESERINIYNQVRDMMSENNNQQEIHIGVQENFQISSKKNCHDIFEEWADNNVTKNSSDEVQSYLEHSITGEDIEDETLLAWWKNSPFTKLANIARRVLSIPASSTSSERDFSVAGRVLEQRRCNLAVDAILFLRHYGKHS